MTYRPYDGLLLTPAEAARLQRRAEIMSEVAALREKGATLAEIGSKYGVSAHQILANVSGGTSQRRTG